MKKIKLISILLALSIILCGCSVSKENDSQQTEQEITVSQSADDIIDVTDMFTQRDLDYDYSNKDVYNITLSDNASSSDTQNTSIIGNNITINNEGVYVLTGKLSNGQIIIDADENDKIQIVLNTVNINCDNSASIYCKSAKKLFITTIGESKLSNKSDYINDDENINGVIYSKSDLTLNGNNKLTINASYGNAIVSKDDLSITSGEYDLTAKKHSIKANDSVRIATATLKLNSTEDAIHCKNDDITKGFVYIESGDLTINANDVGIQSSSAIKICNGNIDIESSKEGIEGRFIDISGGNINITSSDDGINATDKSQEESNTNQMENSSDVTFNNNQKAPPKMPNDNKEMKDSPANMPKNNDQPANDKENQMPKDDFDNINNISNDCSLLISNGNITINANGDGIDSNGIIKITGGKTIVYSAENNGNNAFDYETQATITGGSIIALGMSGMAQGFSNSSTQCSILYNTNFEGSANDTIELKHNGKSIISTTALKKYDSILISSPEITQGKYSLKTGNTSQKIELNSLTYSNADNNSFNAKNDFKKEANNEFQP